MGRMARFAAAILLVGAVAGCASTSALVLR
jgi:hypothetical protein